MDNSSIQCDYTVLARSISKHVSSLEEVDFSKSTLMNKLASEWKKKPDRKMRSKFQSLWNKSIPLRKEVERILSGKASTSCKDQGETSVKIIDDDCENEGNTVSNMHLVDSAVQFTQVESEERCDTSMTIESTETTIVASNHTGGFEMIDAGVHFQDLSAEDCNSVDESVNAKTFSVNDFDNKVFNITDDLRSNDREYTEDLESSEMSEAFDSQFCDLSLKKSTIPRTYERKTIANQELSVSRNATLSTIYDFTDSEYESEKNKENSPPPKPQSRKEKYSVDLGEKHPYSARFKDSDGIVTKHTIRKGLKTLLATEYGGTCSLRFSTIRFNETDCVAYARCMSVEHRQYFKFTLTDLKELIATVFTTSSAKISFKHEKRNFAQLRGAERDAVKDALKTRQPRAYQMEVAKNIDSSLAADGNMQELRRLYIYQKAKSEENCKNDLVLKSGDLSDLMQLWMDQNNEKDPYLRHASLPLTAIMFTEAQLNLLDHCKRIVLHLDATGSVVRKPSHLDCKRIYYYVIVTKHRESVIPIAEMVTSEHNIRSIAAFLKMYKFFVQEKWNNWPFVSAIVVDWSWALMNSLFFEWNQMSVGDYLNIAYEYLTKGQRPKNLIIVQTCCAHFMKRMSNIIKKDFSQYENVKSFLLECIAVMMLCRNMNELENVFEHFVKAVSTPDEEDAQSGLHALGKIIKDRQVEVTDVTHYSKDEQSGEEAQSETPKPSVDSASLKKSKAIFANSPFFIHFEEKLKQLESGIDNEKAITNRYYVPGFARQMVWKHLPYAPIWTSMMLDLVDPNISRLSNAYVESYNKVIKHQVLNHQKNLKVGHFIRKTESYTRSLIAEAKLDVTLKTKEPSEKPKYPKTSKTNVITAPKAIRSDNIPKSSTQSVDIKGLAQEEYLKDLDLQEPMQIDNLCPEEASDPFIGETWKDTKKCVYAKGHFQGSVLGRLANRINKKAVENTEIPLTDLRGADMASKSELKTSGSHDPKSCDIPMKSSLVEDSDVLENGLFNNYHYYMQSRSHNVRIACFIAANNPPIRSNCFQLTARQFHTLAPNRWIDGLVIDCYSMTHIDTWENSMYMSTDDTGSIFGNNWDLRKPPSCGIYNISRTLGGRILMPYMYNGHWRLFIVDVDQKQLTLLDPYQKTNDQGRLMEAFKNFLAATNNNSTFGQLRKIQWEVNEEYILRPHQASHDAVNCGAYVSYYVQCLATNAPFDLQFDPVKFREHMAKTIIEKSSSVKEMCMYCLGKQYENEVINCGTCRHWCHTTCIEKGDYDSEKEEDEDDQLKRFRKRSKTTARPPKKQKTISIDPHVIYTCKLCRRNNGSNLK